MATVISVPTILFCTFLLFVAMSVTMTAMWFRNRREKSAAYWSAAFIAATLAGLLLALQPLAPVFFVGIGNVFVCLGVSLIWLGFRAFNGAAAPLVVAAIAPAVWTVAYLAIPELRADQNWGIAFLSSVIAFFAFMAAGEVYRGRKAEPLPTRLPAAILFAIHGAVHVSHLWFVLFDPAPIVNGLPQASWWVFFMLEAFLGHTFLFISCLVLIKERVEFKYKRASEIDHLTGVRNRGAFVRSVRERLGSGGRLAVLDLDHFKRINDTFGHPAGDQALVDFARIAGELVPEGAVFGRLGGEEFGLFLPADAASIDVLENIRARVASHQIDMAGMRFGFTVSVGFSDDGASNASLENMMASADAALYAAKAGGRNRICTFDPVAMLHAAQNGHDPVQPQGISGEAMQALASRAC